MLYPGGVTTIDDAELTGCVMWFGHVKKVMARFFHHFFKPAPVSQGKPVNWLEQMNAQIRALTDGDIYTLSGQHTGQRYADLPAGIYLVKKGNHYQKIQKR